jgi:hypothetical protein
MGELSTLSNRQWEALPELKKKKVVLAGRLGQFEWPPGPMHPELFDLKTLKSLVTDLENHSRQRIQVQLELIGTQILALQELRQYWRECQSVSFRKWHDPIPSR